MNQKARVVSIAALLLLALGFVALHAVLAQRSPSGSGGIPAMAGPGGGPGGAAPAAPLRAGGTAPVQPGAKDQSGAVPGTPAKVLSAETSFSVQVETVHSQRLQPEIAIGGDIATETNVDVLSDSSGKLISLRAVLGQTVRSGELLAEVDPSKPGSNYAISPVYSPISGTITAVSGQIGATIGSATVIARVGNMDQLVVKAKVAERDIGLLAIGLQAAVQVAAWPGVDFPARLASLDPVVDSVSRTKTVILRFTARDERLNPGMYASVRLFAQARPAALTVPDSAVLSVDGQPCVYVVAPNADRVSRRSVTVGASLKGRSEIRSGLQNGEQVVIAGQERLSDGAKVLVLAGGSGQ